LGGSVNTGKTWSWGTDAAEESLNTLIERRAKEAGEANHAARSWAESVRRYNLRSQAELREQWRRFHNDMSRVHARIAAEHEAKAAALTSEGGGGR
jgi:hypothetical protein